jgi:hypothetical protein
MQKPMKDAMDVALIGESNSGKATFLVLLYAAQIRYSEFSTNKESEFRFYINPSDINNISSEYNQMQMGNWPSDKLVHMKKSISFLYGRTKETGASKFLGFFGKKLEPETFSANFSIYDFSDPDLVEVVNNETMTYMNILPKVEGLLSSRVILMVLDSSKLHKKTTKQNGDQCPDVDIQITTALSNITRFKRKTIFPVILFAKSDSMNKHYLSSLRLPSNVPSVKNSKARKIIAERLMTNNYPNTLNFLKKNKKIDYNTIVHIFSSVKTVHKKSGEVAPALKLTPDAGYVLDCEYNEFIYFIEQLERISEKIEKE